MNQPGVIMEISAAYSPSEIFGVEESGQVPRVFIAPSRYVQGPGVVNGMGRYLSLLKCDRVAILISRRGRSVEGERFTAVLEAANKEPIFTEFEGECSTEEIETKVQELATKTVGCVIAVGGGKCIDAGKAIAFRLGIPSVIVPTLASNDAPCSALSVIYSTAGVSTGVEFYPNSPALVVVDTEIIAAAPERYLVSGIGDAMATWYEADVCLRNPSAITAVFARPTLASSAIGSVCASTLFEQGKAAAGAVANNRVDAVLENVVEANTLLSGLGFESGGVAAAHGIAQSYTALPTVHANYLHGEMVAMGTLAQLMMEERHSEAKKVAQFFSDVGLPIHLGQLSLAPTDTAALETIVEAALTFPFMSNMPMAVDADMVRQAILGAHALGRQISEEYGDESYRRLHGN